VPHAHPANSAFLNQGDAPQQLRIFVSETVGVHLGQKQWALMSKIMRHVPGQHTRSSRSTGQVSSASSIRVWLV
jgi:hypothetical protein